MNLNIKIFASLLFTLAFATVALADLKPFCINVYCERSSDPLKRFKPAGPGHNHSIYFSAMWSEEERAYFLNTDTFDKLRRLDCKRPMAAVLYGVNADTIFGKVFNVYPFLEQSFQKDEKCEARKQ